MRPERVQDKVKKAGIRNSAQSTKITVSSEEPQEILPFVNRIICGDAPKALAQIPDASIDLIITSPPYNFGQAYAQDPHDDTHEWNSYFEKLLVVWRECERVLKPGGRMAVNIQPLFSDYVPTHHLISHRACRPWAFMESRVSLGEK